MMQQVLTAALMHLPNQIAPGELEHVRRFVNTWSIPNDTRLPEDELHSLCTSPANWEALFPFALSKWDRPESVTRFRDDLRTAVEYPLKAGALLNKWINETGAGLLIDTSPDGVPLLRFRCRNESAIASLLTIAIHAVQSSEWLRMKCCPDCKWCFFDSTRSGTKRWCGMTKGGPGGRACGTIAKVRRYRERQKGTLEIDV